MKRTPSGKAVVFLALLFGLMSLCLMAGAAPAAERAAQKKPVSQAATQQTIELKTEDLKFEQKPSRRIPSKMTLQEKEKAVADSKLAIRPIKKVDLVCEIKAYYDTAHTMPVPGGPNMGTYHLMPGQGPQRPFPYYAFFVVEVKNTGLVTKAMNVTNRAAFTGIPQFFPPKTFVTSPPEALDPGEAVEYPFWFGPVGPSMILTGKKIVVNATADFPPRVTEDNEGNNNCTYTLSLVWP